MQFNNPNSGGYGDSPYGYGGDSGMPYMGNMGQPPQQRARGRGRLGCLSVVIALAVLAFVIGHFGLNLNLNGGPTTIQTAQTPTLIIQGYARNLTLIQVHSGAPGQIAIQTQHFIIGLPDTYQESSDKHVVIYQVDPEASGTIDVTVPANSNLKIDSNDTAILVDGISGQMIVNSNGGSITIQKSTLMGPSLIRSNSGTVKLTGTTLQGASAIDNNSGDITFEGIIKGTSQGTLRFSNNSGGLTVTLDAGSGAKIDANSTSGEIITGIPGAKVNKGEIGLELHTQIGEPPLASLILYSNQGAITVNQ